MIYFDNSATTNKKPKEVISACNNALLNYSANPGRSGHFLSLKTATKVFEIRKKIADYINCDKVENVIFTQNCTDALNMAILGTYIKGGHVICSQNDHNSLIRPIFELKKKGLIDVSIAHAENGHTLTAKDIEKHLRPNTYLVAINHVSNVNGDSAQIEQIGELCTKRCILFLVDCAQSMGHEIINMKKQHIDMLAIAPHKGLYAMQGIGIFAFSVKVSPKPIRFGGTGTESDNSYQPTDFPECLESGTIATPNIFSVEAGIDFVKNNQNLINKKIDDLSTFLLYELNKINEIKLYTHTANVHYGIIAFNVSGLDSNETASILSDNFNICVRGGLHCAGIKHSQLNTIHSGIVRASLSYYNSFTECEKFIKTIKIISKKMN